MPFFDQPKPKLTLGFGLGASYLPDADIVWLLKYTTFPSSLGIFIQQAISVLGHHAFYGWTDYNKIIPVVKSEPNMKPAQPERTSTFLSTR